MNTKLREAREVRFKEMAEVKDRNKAIAVRYGGEEMLLIFFMADKARAKGVVERTIKEMEGMKYPSGRKARHDVVTLSCGLVMSTRAPKDNVEAYYDLIAQADKNLYAAKSYGKNRCVG